MHLPHLPFRLTPVVWFSSLVLGFFKIHTAKPEIATEYAEPPNGHRLCNSYYCDYCS